MISKNPSQSLQRLTQALIDRNSFLLHHHRQLNLIRKFSINRPGLELQLQQSKYSKNYSRYITKSIHSLDQYRCKSSTSSHNKRTISIESRQYSSQSDKQGNNTKSKWNKFKIPMILLILLAPFPFLLKTKSKQTNQMDQEMKKQMEQFRKQLESYMIRQCQLYEKEWNILEKIRDFYGGKYDRQVILLDGDQGIGKSTFLNFWSKIRDKAQYFKDSDVPQVKYIDFEQDSKLQNAKKIIQKSNRSVIIINGYDDYHSQLDDIIQKSIDNDKSMMFVLITSTYPKPQMLKNIKDQKKEIVYLKQPSIKQMYKKTQEILFKKFPQIAQKIMNGDKSNQDPVKIQASKQQAKQKFLQEVNSMSLAVGGRIGVLLHEICKQGTTPIDRRSKQINLQYYEVFRAIPGLYDSNRAFSQQRLRSELFFELFKIVRQDYLEQCFLQYQLLPLNLYQSLNLIPEVEWKLKQGQIADERFFQQRILYRNVQNGTVSFYSKKVKLAFNAFCNEITNQYGTELQEYQQIKDKSEKHQAIVKGIQQYLIRQLELGELNQIKKVSGVQKQMNEEGQGQNQIQGGGNQEANSNQVDSKSLADNKKQ